MFVLKLVFHLVLLSFLLPKVTSIIRLSSDQVFLLEYCILNPGIVMTSLLSTYPLLWLSHQVWYLDYFLSSLGCLLFSFYLPDMDYRLKDLQIEFYYILILEFWVILAHILRYIELLLYLGTWTLSSINFFCTRILKHQLATVLDIGMQSCYWTALER